MRYFTMPRNALLAVLAVAAAFQPRSALAADPLTRAGSVVEPESRAAHLELGGGT